MDVGVDEDLLTGMVRGMDRMRILLPDLDRTGLGLDRGVRQRESWLLRLRGSLVGESSEMSKSSLSSWSCASFASEPPCDMVSTGGAAWIVSTGCAAMISWECAGAECDRSLVIRFHRVVDVVVRYFSGEGNISNCVVQMILRYQLEGVLSRAAQVARARLTHKTLHRK